MFVEMRQKIILFGGTFDPIHYGHIRIAESAIQQIAADQLVFIPAKRSPHKKSFPVASAKERLEMISLAIAGKDNFSLTDCELKRPEPSFTLDTVRSFRAQYPEDAEVYWLVGADMVKDLTKWHRICDLIDQCNLCVMPRPGFERPSFAGLKGVLGRQRLEKLQRNVISTPLVDISGTQIMKKLACGDDVEPMLPPRVLAYIRKNGLYAGL